MLIALIVALILLGLFLILLELFVTPGLITGLLGGVAWIYALYRIYTDFGELSGHLALAGLLLLLIACIFIAVRSGVWDKVSLKSSVEGRVNDLPDLHIGDKGTTGSMLRPMGKAIFDNKTVEVSSAGEMIESGKEIEIYKIENNRIYVKETQI